MIIRSDGKVESIKPSNGENFTLSEMQEIVNGHIEILTLGKLGVFMVVHEEGKLIDLPFNDIATGYMKTDGTYKGDFVVGDVLVAQFSEID